MKHGAEVTHESADVVLMEDSLWKLVKAVEISRDSVTLIKQNYAIVAGMNTIALALVLPGGLISPSVTALISNGSAIVASLNGMRLFTLQMKPPAPEQLSRLRILRRFGERSYCWNEQLRHAALGICRTASKLRLAKDAEDDKRSAEPHCGDRHLKSLDVAIKSIKRHRSGLQRQNFHRCCWDKWWRWGFSAPRRFRSNFP